LTGVRSIPSRLFALVETGAVLHAWLTSYAVARHAVWGVLCLKVHESYALFLNSYDAFDLTVNSYDRNATRCLVTISAGQGTGGDSFRRVQHGRPRLSELCGPHL
jgi:hypothetical protein